jgi:amino acid transporter
MGGFSANRRQLLALALISVLNNSTAKWQYSLRAGLGYEIIFNFFCALACIIYYCCASELTSTFPFPGGCFGFARCTVGFYPAFLIGCLEIFYYFTSLSITTSFIALMIYIGFPHLKPLRYLIVFGVYLVQYCLCLSKKLFYHVATVLALYGVVICVIYILGSCSEVDFNRWAFRVNTGGQYWNDDGAGVYPPVVDDDEYYKNSVFDYASVDRSDAIFNDHTSVVVQSIGRCFAVYMQVEYANLAVDDARDPRRDIPFALLAAAGIQFIFGTLDPIIAALTPPGVEAVSKMPWPMVPGLARIFGIPQHHAVILMVPIWFARTLATCFALGKLLSSMAGSNLFPRILARKQWDDDTPVYALTTASIISIIATLLFQWFQVGNVTIYAGPGINLVLLCGLITYFIQVFGFMVMRVKLAMIPSMFRSPFGLLGATYAGIAFVVGMVSALYVPPRQRAFIIVFTVIFVLIPTFYYYAYAKHVQTFSDAEKEVMLQAHAEIRNANGKLLDGCICLS